MTIWIGLAAMLALASPSDKIQSAPKDETSTFLMDVSGWSLMMDHTLNNACYIGKGTADGVAIRLTYDDSRERIYFVAASRFWKSIDNDKRYRLSVRFDGEQPWAVDATGQRLNNGVPFLGFEVDDVEFLQDLKRSNALTIEWNGKTVVRASLAGSSNALAMLAECQKVADEGRDPFTNERIPIPPPIRAPARPQPSRDPFDS